MMSITDPIMQEIWQIKDALSQRYQQNPEKYLQELQAAQRDFINAHPEMKVLNYVPSAHREQAA